MPTTDTVEQHDPIRCFISYARSDNETFNGVVDQFKKSLQGMYEAKTGRTLEVFVDRDDLGWGDDWRSGITEAVKSATAFIPMISMKYFTRPRCREELMAFYENARIMEVTGLILPVILAGGDRIRADDERKEVRIIEQLNHKSIETAMLEGYNSGAWLTRMNDITLNLIRSVEKAETHLAERERSNGRTANQSVLTPTSNAIEDESGAPSAEPDDAPGLFELMQIFTDECQLMTESGDKAFADFAEFSRVLAEQFESLGSKPSPQAVTKAAPVMAQSLQGPSSDFGISGAEVAVHASRADAAIRQVVAEIQASEVPFLKEQMSEQLEKIRAGLDDTNIPFEQIEEVQGYIKMAQMISVSLRKALAPASRGFAGLRDTTRIIASWRDIQP
ncbi:toll/interleukin-1 receptor domain-containing protein [Polymorphospora sp. NPDC050346]|uniref:toll/interleukin-1 receptor domain-containing protein n=1 Tax=Polymorphospora sp. NPDC050346 TaxID=3155780 RepID=UPI0033D1FC75